MPRSQAYIRTQRSTMRRSSASTTSMSQRTEARTVVGDVVVEEAQHVVHDVGEVLVVLHAVAAPVVLLRELHHEGIHVGDEVPRLQQPPRAVVALQFGQDVHDHRHEIVGVRRHRAQQVGVQLVQFLLHLVRFYGSAHPRVRTEAVEERENGHRLGDQLRVLVEAVDRAEHVDREHGQLAGRHYG